MTISLISGPTPAPLSDAFANPTASAIYSLSGVWNGTTWDRQVSASGDSLSSSGLPANSNYVYNGTNWDRLSSASRASNTSGAGLLGAGMLAWDGTAYQRLGAVAGDTGYQSLVASGRKEVTFSSVGIGSNAVGATGDITPYRWMALQVTGVGAGAVLTFQGSNDNTNWQGVNLTQTGASTTFAVNQINFTGLFYGSVNYRYFRIFVTGQTSGTTSGVIELFTLPGAQNTMQVLSSLAAVTTAPGDAVGLPWVPNEIFNGTNWDRVRSVGIGDAVAATGIQASGGYLYNGTTYDRARSLGAMSTTTNASTGIQAVGLMYYDGTNFRIVRGDSFGGINLSNTIVSGVADANAISSAFVVGNYIYNGTTWDRIRSATGAPTGTTAVAPMATSTGGATQYKLTSAATTNATSLKASAGSVYEIYAINTTATARYLKLFDKASAPTLGTDVPSQTFLIPPNTSAPLQIIQHVGKAFAAGIAFAITANIGDADATAIAANDVVLNIDYK